MKRRREKQTNEKYTHSLPNKYKQQTYKKMWSKSWYSSLSVVIYVINATNKYSC